MSSEDYIHDRPYFHVSIRALRQSVQKVCLVVRLIVIMKFNNKNVYTSSRILGVVIRKGVARYNDLRSPILCSSMDAV